MDVGGGCWWLGVAVSSCKWLIVVLNGWGGLRLALKQGNEIVIMKTIWLKFRTYS